MINFARRYEGAGLKYHIGMGVCRHGRGFGLNDDLETERIRFRILALVNEVNKTSPQHVINECLSCGYCEQLVIGPDGNIYPCHLLEGAIGHVNDMPLHDFFFKIRDIAKQHQVENMEICKNCDLRKICGGTCRVINKKFNGSKLKPTCSSKEQSEKMRSLVYWASE